MVQVTPVDPALKRGHFGFYSTGACSARAIRPFIDRALLRKGQGPTTNLPCSANWPGAAKRVLLPAEDPSVDPPGGSDARQRAAAETSGPVRQLSPAPARGGSP